MHRSKRRRELRGNSGAHLNCQATCGIKLDHCGTLETSCARRKLCQNWHGITRDSGVLACMGLEVTSMAVPLAMLYELSIPWRRCIFVKHGANPLSFVVALIDPPSTVILSRDYDRTTRSSQRLKKADDAKCRIYYETRTPRYRPRDTLYIPILIQLHVDNFNSTTSTRQVHSTTSILQRQLHRPGSA